MTRRAAIYLRISDDKAGEGLGVLRQEEDCRDKAKELGFDDPVVFPDNDISAYNGRKRPAYLRLLEALKTGQFAVVIAWHGDRLHRAPIELENYIAVVEKHDVETHFVTGGRVDLTTPTGRMVARTVGNMARYESEHKAERIRRAHQQSAQLGKWRGGTRPFGYQYDATTVDAEETALIQAAYLAVTTGISLGQICREWNAAGIRTSTGREWGVQSLKQLLLRERNLGVSLYRGQVVGPAQWQAIIDEETFRRAKAILSDPSRRRSFDTRGKWLLAGLGLCGVCASQGKKTTVRSAVSGGSPDKRWPIYRCVSGLHLARNAEKCDALIAEVVLGYLSGQNALEMISMRRSNPLRNGKPLGLQAEELRQEIDEAKSLWKDSIISTEELRSKVTDLRSRLAAVEVQMTTGSDPTLADLLNASDIRHAWGAFTWAQKRSVIDLLMVVTIMPVPTSRQRAFHTDLIKINWK